ncbi:hypothetical protein ZHAS_00012165 [Anopheles sinensis]|uniref:Uncharacterized protein n=1 Tax=Anopheles sinensis TaxID=74873 RepID=A0A084W252_ANOSI|nr:hypothetical protein ZHAS_00012165 [Anopheles sinensis]
MTHSCIWCKFDSSTPLDQRTQRNWLVRVGARKTRGPEDQPLVVRRYGTVQSVHAVTPQPPSGEQLMQPKPRRWPSRRATQPEKSTNWCRLHHYERTSQHGKLPF